MARVWIPLWFGKHKGKTLPQVVFADPDYFFWAIEKRKFPIELVAEAREMETDGLPSEIIEGGA
jgi:hypothetical protein